MLKWDVTLQFVDRQFECGFYRRAEADAFARYMQKMPGFVGAGVYRTDTTKLATTFGNFDEARAA